jgi:serine/threonine-protein kinase RsbW
VNESSNEQVVVLTVPATPEHLSLLRSLVGYYAGRERFTIDQIDDLRMAVDEAGVQLLRHVAGDQVRLELTRTGPELVMRVSADVSGEEPVIDRESFSWTILRALADDLRVEMQQAHATLVLVKHRTAVERRTEP